MARMGLLLPARDARSRGQTWHVLVNNVSPEGENWSFNTFYPDYLQVHPGDTIVFTLAPNPQAFHTVQILTVGMTPMEFYQGFPGGFRQPDPTRPGEWQSPYFGGRPPHPVRARWARPVPVRLPTTLDADWDSGSTPASWSIRRRAGGEGNTSASPSPWIPALPPAPTTS